MKIYSITTGNKWWSWSGKKSPLYLEENEFQSNRWREASSHLGPERIFDFPFLPCMNLLAIVLKPTTWEFMDNGSTFFKGDWPLIVVSLKIFKWHYYISWGLLSKYGKTLSNRSPMNQRSDGGIYGKISELPVRSIRWNGWINEICFPCLNWTNIFFIFISRSSMILINTNV